MVSASSSASTASTPHDTVVEVVMSVLGLVEMTEIDGSELTTVIVTVDVAEPPCVSVMTAVQ